MEQSRHSRRKESVFFLSKQRNIGFLKKWQESYDSFSPAEKVLFIIFVIIVVCLSTFSFLKLYSTILVEVPTKGGSYTEGIIGIPRFINPLLALSDADRDITQLVYSGLMKATPNGTFIPDLAERYTISSDGLTYDFFLKKDVTFQDGIPVTADDVDFTIKKAQDPLIKSQKRAIWDGITVKVIDPLHIQFTLKQAYAPFLESTTLGILPKHIWKDITIDQFPFNINDIQPIGSGPYMIKNIIQDGSRTPTEYQLVPFKDYTLGVAYISSLNIKLYSGETDLVKAYENGEISGMGGIDQRIVTEYAQKGRTVIDAELPRIFAVFFNQNQNDALLDSNVRLALDMATDRDTLIKEVLQNYGTAIDTPFVQTEKIPTFDPDSIVQANKLLDLNGWKLSTTTGFREKKTKTGTTTLAFTLSTADKTDLKLTATLLQSQWKKIGANVSIGIYENGDLNQNIIRPRKYEALLFGEIVGRDMDLYPFWHSSQRNDPGLNVALYTNIKADKALETLRNEQDQDKRKVALQNFLNEIEKDKPALFLYSPKYTYIVPNNIHGIDLKKITLPAERFLNINKWYSETNNVLNIFNTKIN